MDNINLRGESMRKIRITYVNDEWLAQYTGFTATVIEETDEILRCEVEDISGTYKIDLIKGKDCYKEISCD